MRNNFQYLVLNSKLLSILRVNWQLVILLAIVILAAFLRFYKLSSNPPGLYWDEAAFGYDAYSILKTGQDHHGQFLPIFFESFGDWKLPGYFYLLVPSIALFDLNALAVRFPSAFFGVLSVIVFFCLVRKLTDNINLSLASSFFLAISPWHIQFSRGGFESTVGLFFVVLGVYLLLLGFEKQKTSLLTFAFLLLTLSMYTYHAYRILTPLLGLSLLIIYFGQIKKNIGKLVLPGVLSLFLLLPLIFFTFSPQGRTRAVSQAAFTREDFQKAKIDYDQKSKKPLRFLSGYLYQKPVYYSVIAAKNYLDHFSPVFLFFKGDQIGRHSQVDMGQIYTFEGLLLIFSILLITKIQGAAWKLMLAWLLIAPIPAMIVAPTPHAYRTLPMAVPLAFFAGLGIIFFFSQKRLILAKIIIIAIFTYSFLTYLHLLFIHYPVKFAADWQDGYAQMVAQVQKYQEKFDKVYVTNVNQVPYIYLLFYQKYDPKKFIVSGGNRNAFDKYVFISDEVNIYDKGKILYVAPSWKKVDGTWLTSVNDSAGRHLYSLWEIDGKN